MFPSRFIGGQTIETATRRMRQQIYIPIYDYAKEGSNTHKEALEYVQRMKIDSKYVPNGSVFALKYSSFNDGCLMNSLVGHLHSCEP